ncbi:hypothetical protein [Brevundimonas lenta]|uniref:Uncharacterized protein n=1 Tax=Brevundimonas lenta TaxID=424796 RepID=A0A7W6JD30_9CAUL|nr:hypothetical protein [Brevundimonas lenta]MBB4082915.1 hypothetical protein [Brevundimonas lenta]
MLAVLAAAAALSLAPQDGPTHKWLLIGMGEDSIFGADAGSVRREGDIAHITGVVVEAAVTDGRRYYVTTTRFDCAARTGHVARIDTFGPDGAPLEVHQPEADVDLGGRNSVLERQFNAACSNDWPFDQANEASALDFSRWAVRDVIDNGVLAQLNANARPGQ